MAITPEQAAANEVAERRTRAQAYAYEWMEHAQQAETAPADAGTSKGASYAAQLDSVSALRRVADRAMVFAQAWARVASVLEVPLEPVECELRSTDG